MNKKIIEIRVRQLVITGHLVGGVLALIIKDDHLRDLFPHLGRYPVQNLVNGRLCVVSDDANDNLLQAGFSSLRDPVFSGVWKSSNSKDLSPEKKTTELRLISATS